MQQYKLKTGEIVSLEGLAQHFPLSSFPADIGPDADWMAANGVEPYTPPTPAPTQEDIAAQLEAGLDAFFESKVAEHNGAVGTTFADRHSLIERAGFPGPYQAMAQAFGTWMDTCNAYAQSVKSACLAGTRAIPTLDQLISELPPLVWP
jgi:hypothetical protein